VVKGKDIKKMLEAGIEKMGGWQKFIKEGKHVVLKLNAAWISKPEEGGNTSPELAKECIIACKKAGATRVLVPENPCSPAKDSFVISGISKACEEAGSKLYTLNRKEDYIKVSLPAGVKLKEAEVVKDVLEAPSLINMPVAKTHGGSILTMAMKNWMGCVKDRGYWHRNDLHQCIADFCTLIKANLIIMDATRILLTNGPRGPGKLAYPEEIIFGTDIVAVDAYGTTLFNKQPFDIRHIQIAHNMGIGCGDLSKINIVRIAI
jgi:uncharacterized protein (DUF362 family)